MEKINYAASAAYFVKSDTFITFPEGSGSRDISSQTGQPMEIFGGTYEESQIAPRAEWLR
jgi:hypothetical protein